jgi:hypothetical protein
LNYAYKVYENGAFSEPIAKITLGVPLSKPLSEGDEVIGYSTGGSNEVKGKLIDNFAKDSPEIQVVYDTNEVQATYVGCQVGGNPKPKTEGCKFVVLSYFPGSECIAAHCFLIPF